MTAESRERELLLAVVDAVTAASDLRVLAARVAHLVTDATGTDVCFVYVLDDDRTALTLAGATAPFDRHAGAVALPFGEGVTGWVAAERKPVVLVDDKETDHRYRHIPELGDEPFPSLASVPMLSTPGGLQGVLNVHTRIRREFARAEVEQLERIGRLVAGAVHTARLHRALVARQRAHELLAEGFVAMQERERRRIAAEIHDGVAQRLVSLSFHLSAAADAIADDRRFAAEQLAEARVLAELAGAETRAAVAGLRPPVLDDLGLVQAIASLARTTPAATVDVDPDVERLPDHARISLYRIAQEALQNAAKHADAARVSVVLRCTDTEAVLTVADDGEGFVPQQAGDGYGLVTMRERAELVGGTVDITSRPGRGTTLTVTIPRHHGGGPDE